MTYFKVDDKLHSHVKSMRAGVPALGLWVLAASWTMDQQTDGWVPEYAALRLDPDAAEHAASLVRAGLWHQAERDGEAGWQFHEWDDWQHSVQYLNERKRRNADRMRTKRANEAAGEQAADLQEQPVRAHNADTAHTVQPQCGALTTTTTTTTKKDTRKREAAAAGASADFDRFWTLYPRKVGKAAAAKAWAKATKDTDVATIAAGLRNAIAVWDAARTEVRFIPHPSTWLNEGRWADEQPLLPSTGQLDRQDPAAAIQATYDLPPLPEPPEHIRDAGGKAYTTWMRETRAAQRAELERQAGVR